MVRKKILLLLSRRLLIAFKQRQITAPTELETAEEENWRSCEMCGL